MYNYNALVTRVVDGDTFDATVDLGFTVSVKVRFRVANFDAPETYRPKNKAEAAHGGKATELAKSLIENKKVIITSHRGERAISTGSFGRWLGNITLSDGRDFVDVMVENGMEKLSNYTVEREDV